MTKGASRLSNHLVRFAHEDSRDRVARAMKRARDCNHHSSPDSHRPARITLPSVTAREAVSSADQGKGRAAVLCWPWRYERARAGPWDRSGPRAFWLLTVSFLSAPAQMNNPLSTQVHTEAESRHRDRITVLENRPVTRNRTVWVWYIALRIPHSKRLQGPHPRLTRSPPRGELPLSHCRLSRSIGPVRSFSQALKN